eukprot:09830.XXX_147009_151198_1 [CDS] Oithona nana genome sequencing.
MENFKEMTKRDAQISLNQELLKLRKTSNLTQEKNELIDKELEGFQRLFSQYLAADVAAPIHWEKIEKLPQGSSSVIRVRWRFFHIHSLFRWYPPGHGDFYQAFHNSGLLEELVDQGRKYVFLSNIDNLGATKFNDFLKRFASIPDIIELDHLTVSGNVTFGKKVVLKGTVIIIANHGEQIDIPSGAILENKIVSGNLRILDH